MFSCTVGLVNKCGYISIIVLLIKCILVEDPIIAVAVSSGNENFLRHHIFE